MKTDHPTTPVEFTVATQADVAAFCGVTTDTVKRWRAQGMPGRPKCYPLGAIVRWLRTAGPWQARVVATGDDAVFSGPDTPSLERGRLARAIEIERRLAKDEGLIHAPSHFAFADTWLQHLRRLGERLQREHPAAYPLFDELLIQAHETARHTLVTWRTRRNVSEENPLGDCRECLGLAPIGGVRPAYDADRADVPDATAALAKGDACDPAQESSDRPPAIPGGGNAARRCGLAGGNRADACGVPPPAAEADEEPAEPTKG